MPQLIISFIPVRLILLFHLPIFKLLFDVFFGLPDFGLLDHAFTLSNCGAVAVGWMRFHKFLNICVSVQVALLAGEGYFVDGFDFGLLVVRD